MKSVKIMESHKTGYTKKQSPSPNSSKLNKNNLYANVSPRYLQPRSQKNLKKINELNSSRIKTVDVQQIKQIAQKHYQKAMKYVYKKNTQQKQVKIRQQEKLNLKQQPLTKQHTFKPHILKNKYNQKIQQMKGNNPKHIELYKWGMNHRALRRENVIQGQIRQIRKTLQKQYGSLEKSRNQSISRSLENSFEKSIDKSLVSTVSKQTVTNEIPGVKKYYLNQAKAQISKSNNQRLMFRGNDATGYYF